MKNAKLIVTMQATFLIGLLIFSGAIANVNQQGAIPSPDTMLKAQLGLQIDEDPAAYERLASDEGKMTTLANMLKSLRDGNVDPTLTEAGVVDGQKAYTTAVEGLNLVLLPTAQIAELKDVQGALSGQVGIIKTSSSGVMTVLSIEELLAMQPAAQREVDVVVERLRQGDTALAINRAIIFNELPSDIGAAQYILPSLLTKNVNGNRVFLALATNPSTEGPLYVVVFTPESDAVTLQTVDTEDVAGLASVRNTADTIVTTNWVKMLAQHEPSSLKTMSSSLPFTGTAKASSAGVKAVAVDSVILNIAGQQIQINQNALDAIIEASDTNRGLLTEIEQLRFALDLNMKIQDIQDVFIGQAKFIETGEAIGDTAFLLVPTGVTGLKSQILVAVVNDNTPQEAVVAGIVESIAAAKAIPSLGKTSSSGLAELIKFNETSVGFIDDHAQLVLKAVNRFEALKDPASVAKENVNSAINELRDTLDALNRAQGNLEKTAVTEGGLSDSARQELDKLYRVVDGMIANLDTTINRTQDAVASLAALTASPEQGAPDLVKTRPNILVETGGIIGKRIDIAANTRTFSEADNQDISQLEFVNNTATCTMKGVNPANLTAADLNNAIAVAETEAGAKAFRAQGLEVFMLSDLEAEGVYDLLSLAIFAKGRFLRASGVENPALRALMEFAYKSLTNTNQAMPAEFFASTPLATVISISLQPVTRVYEEGELEAYHLMRLLAMIAA